MRNSKFWRPISHNAQVQPEMTEAIKINNFRALLRKEALQIFRNVSASNRKTLKDVLILF